ncbi:MAG TPA: glycosyltransferase, partial [Nocardioides sp.]|nr:glycosyltransferase [Nocardioides sp.]
DELHAGWSGAASGPPEVVVGYVGRVAAEKQVRRLADVARIPGARLVVVGDGPERGWLEQRIPGAHFTGMLGGEDLATAFASLDVFVHPGESETFCQTVQEAQASGVPVVAAAAGGPLDLVRHGRTGLLFDPSDPEALCREVATLVDDPDLRGRLARQALGDVAGRSWGAVVGQLVEEHYLPVVARRSIPSAA